MSIKEPLLKVKNLKKYFNVSKGLLHAVDDVSFEIFDGQTLGFVGESGCGKSTLGRCILRLIEPTDGEIIFDGKKIRELSNKDMRYMRRQMQIIFQDPFSSLDPRKTVGEAIEEPLLINRIIKSRQERLSKVRDIMEVVGLSQRLINTYPHELDGGRRQRIGIARALIFKPKFIICDEPVSALDVSIQAQIINLLQELQEEFDLTYVFITHDLSVVNYISDDIAVMYLGKIVEMASSEALFGKPMHPYTKALISAIPVPDIRKKQDMMVLKGEITSPINPEKVCRFAKRCDYAQEVCNLKEPELREIEPGHFVACHLI
jgi:oligopeptide/dipeptide ABC transporter ATP-binding protein